MTAKLKRREFITLLGGAAATWPFSARAQQGERMRRIGVLMNASEGVAEARANVAALREALQQLGWIAGGNIAFHVRWGGGDAALTARHAADRSARAEVELRSPHKLRAYLLSRQDSAPCCRQQCIIVSHARRSPEGGARETWRINACECRSRNHVARSVRKAQASRRRENDLCSLFRHRPC